MSTTTLAAPIRVNTAGVLDVGLQPARVSTILRSSTATRRPRPGRAWTPAVFSRIGATSVVVVMRLFLPARGG